MTRYQNPWHDTDNDCYGPACYSTSAHPVEYKGFLIYERIKSSVWDVVLDGVCVTQRAGLNGAKSYVDNHVSGNVPWR